MRKIIDFIIDVSCLIVAGIFFFGIILIVGGVFWYVSTIIILECEVPVLNFLLRIGLEEGLYIGLILWFIVCCIIVGYCVDKSL